VISVRENACINSKKREKSRFWFRKTRKNVKKNPRVVLQATHSAFSTQLPKVGTGKSPTSNILLRNADTRNYICN